ncbi:hypothetical protein Tco_1029666 [Tanacetum coccineum]|uniref:Uncharacterized protein n=1 Tax=Tanacetum coccineum TaxID=301880 RepID=A0ABQ5G5G7_9ASTR
MESTPRTHRTLAPLRSPNPKWKHQSQVAPKVLHRTKSRKIKKKLEKNVESGQEALGIEEIEKMKVRKRKGKIVEESRSTPFPTPIRSPRIHIDLVSSDTEKLQKFTELQGRYTYLFEHLKARFLSRKSFDTLKDHLQEVMVESLPTMVDTHIKEQVKKQVPKQVRDQVPVEWAYYRLAFSKIHKSIDNHIPSQVDASLRSYMSGNILHVLPTQSQTLSIPEQQYQLPFAVRPRDQDDPHDDAHPEGENSAKRQKTSELWCICVWRLGDGIVWESKRHFVSPHPQKTTPLVQSCQRDPEAPALSLINQDLLYLKKGSSGPEKIVLSLHKFPAIIFNDDDIEERTSRWVEKFVRNLILNARLWC